MRRVLALPLSTVERAGTGDLVSRTTADVDSLARTVRFAIPETLIAAVTAVLTVVAAVLVSPVAAIPCLVGLPAIVHRHALVPPLRACGVSLGARGVRDADRHRRRDRRRRPDDRRARARAASGSAGSTTTSTDAYASRAANALPAHGLVPDRRGRLRPARRGGARLGRLARLHRTCLDRRGDDRHALRPAAHRSGRPADLVARRDPGRRDLVRAARRRLEGSGRPNGRPARSRRDERLQAHDVRYAYREGHDVLHGLDLDLEPGERVAVVGPSGAGKSTLGRLLAGIHPARTGRVDVGGVRLVDLTLETLRREVALVTQEQHVFVGTLADNLRLARVGSSRRRAPGGARRGRRAGVGRGAARRARHGRRRRRLPAEPAAAAAGRARPARARRPAHARARRGDVAARSARGAPPRALARLGARRPHRRRDRPPAPDRARRRPRRRRRGRQARGARRRTTSSSSRTARTRRSGRAGTAGSLTTGIR